MYILRVGNGDDRYDFFNLYNMVKKSNSEGLGSLIILFYVIFFVKEVFFF